MAGLYLPSNPLSNYYRGLPDIFGYENEDGRLRSTNCGLAAAATLLTNLGVMEPARTQIPQANPNMLALESSFPPNILAGLAGTSRGRIERILEAYGSEAVEVDGIEALRESIHRHQPVAVMLQVPGREFLGIPMPAGHWMVAYACDEKKVYLTNWCYEAMSWDSFRSGWSQLMPWCINMQRKGLTARKWTQ